MFITICGSTAVETAIKIAVAYHRAKGNAERFRFVGRERAYHGMNIGATSVGGMINNVKTFASVLMPGVLHMRHTHLPEHKFISCLLYTSPSPRDGLLSRMPSSA